MNELTLVVGAFSAVADSVDSRTCVRKKKLFLPIDHYQTLASVTGVRSPVWPIVAHVFSGKTECSKKAVMKRVLLTAFSVCIALTGIPASAEDMASHSMHQHGSPKMKPMTVEVVANGVVQSVMAETNQLKIRHQPIPEWSMGAMQMKFSLAPGMSTKVFRHGQQIKFRLRQENMMEFTILEVLDE
ncbi:copper-binding protein [Pontibacterium granulatum]|uniref:copper-binding protein n=1 Tax=Pontibacterium granulatum TaxID=2036029 RepID=UPI00249BE409|nr:copper-binding protein [Pontibacterium granulatum]MDI3326337.1 copper-binding protein [Pontibacterium granulatum]